MHSAIRQRLRLSGGGELSFMTAGDASSAAPARLSGLGGLFSGSRARAVTGRLPDRAGYAWLRRVGRSAGALVTAFGQAISELLDRLAVGPRYIYIHDFGAPARFHVAMQAPEKVLGLIVQNGNAHRTC
jgi:hypothetical protein